MVDWDDALGYYTVKYVKVRDCRLGTTQKTLMLLILCKIAGLTMLYQCHHLLEVPVMGSARASAQQPTKGLCDPLHPKCVSDFRPMSELPYCEQYAGEKKLGGERTTGKCIYYDAPAMTRGRSPVPGTLFIPTRVVEYKEKRGCIPTAANKWSCTTKPWVKTAPPTTFMIADIEHFTVLINQAFSADLPGGGGLSGRAADFAAFVKGRPDLVNFFTKRKGFINRMEKDEKSELKEIAKSRPIPDKPDFSGDFEVAFALGTGDVFSVKDLLRMADLRGDELLDEIREDGQTLRYEGGVIAIDITYNNVKHWDVFGKTEPVYTITAKFIPMLQYKIMYESQGGTATDSERTMHDVHGLLFLLTVKGSIRVFTLTHLLTVLTTAMVSLAMATTLTDMIMSYNPCSSMVDRYNLLKYQASQDFSDLQARKEAIAKKEGSWDFDKVKVKTSSAAAKVNEYAMKQVDSPSSVTKISDEDLLAILCIFEMRLNRLDGLDILTNQAEGFEVDNILSNVRTFQKNFRRELGMKVDP